MYKSWGLEREETEQKQVKQQGASKYW